MKVEEKSYDRSESDDAEQSKCDDEPLKQAQEEV